MLEALLLTAVTTGDAGAFAERNAPSKPSLELLEFLGEFGDDEEGLFGSDSGEPGARKPAADARESPAAPEKPKPPAGAPPKAKESR